VSTAAQLPAFRGIVVATVQIARAITLEATLSFPRPRPAITAPFARRFCRQRFDYPYEAASMDQLLLPACALLVTIVSITSSATTFATVLNPRACADDPRRALARRPHDSHPRGRRPADSLLHQGRVVKAGRRRQFFPFCREVLGLVGESGSGKTSRGFSILGFGLSNRALVGGRIVLQG